MSAVPFKTAVPLAIATTLLSLRALAATARDAKLTLVIYMGMTGAAHIQAELLHGLPAGTPVAIVQNVSLPQQRHATCTLSGLAATITRENLGSPSIIVVGDVIAGVAAVPMAQQWMA